MAPPHRWVNSKTSQLREGLEEVFGQCSEGGRSLIEFGIQAVAEVINRVVTAPQDPAVRRQPVVVELITRVTNADARIVPPISARCSGLNGSVTST